MERLTVRRKDGRASIENKMDRNTPLQQAMRIPDVIDRLAAIEDIMGDTYDLDRLRELVEADLEGRCEIHAAKDGDTVYSIFAYVNGLHIRKSNGEPITKVTSYVVDDFTRNTVDREFGKTVFPTSEAAEQALKERGENGT